MARNYESAILLTGDASGAVRAIELTDDHLRQLNARQQRNQKTTSEWSDRWDRATSILQTTALGAGALAAGLAALGVQQIQSVVQTDNQAKALGIATGQLQAMQYAAGTVGIEHDKMGDILKDVSDKIGDAYANGGGEALDVINNLGLSAAELVQMDPAEQLLTIGSALDQLQSQSERVTAMEAIADDASLLLPLLENNTAEFRRLTQQAYDLNIAIPDNEIDTYREAHHAIYELRGGAEGLFNTLISGIAQSDLSGLERSFESLRDTITDPQFQEAVVTIAQALVQMVDWAAEGMQEFTLLGKQIGTVAANIAGYSDEVADLQGKLQRLESMRDSSFFSRAGLFDFGTGLDTYMSDSDIDAAIAHVRSQLEELGVTTDTVTEKNEILTSSALAAANALGGQSQATTVTSSNLKPLIEAYDQQHVKLEQLYSDRAKLQQLTKDDPENADQYRRMLAEVDSQIQKLTQSTQTDTSAKRAAEEAQREHQKALEESAQAYADLFGQLSPVGKAQAEYQSTLAKLQVQVDEGTKSELEFYAAVGQAATVYNDAVAAADPYSVSVEEIVKQYDSAYQHGQQLERSLKAIREAWARDPANADQYARAVAGIRDEMRDLALESDPAAQEMARAWEEAADRIDETFADAFAGAFDSFDDFGDQLLDGFKRLLAELAYQATLKPIVVGFTSDVQGMLGIGGASASGGGGVGGFTNTIAGAKRAWDTGSTLFGGGSAIGGTAAAGYGAAGWAGSATGAYTGWAGSAAAGAASASTIGSMAAAAMPYVGAALVADQVLLGGAISDALGGAISSIGDALGFGSSRKYKAGFVQTAETPDGPAQDRYYDSGNTGRLVGGRQTAFGSFGYTFKEKFEPQDMADMLDAIEQVDNALAAAMDPSEIDAIKTALDGFQTKVQNDPLSDIFNRRLDVIIGAIDTSFDDLLQGVEPDEKVKRLVAGLKVEQITDGLAGAVVDDVNDAFRDAVNDGVDLDEAVASIQSAVASLQQFGAMARSAGLGFDASASGALEAASNINALAGGLDNLSALQQSYVESYYSEAERQQMTLGNLTRQVTAFNEATGASVQDKGGLRDLIDSLDLMTESGQKTYVAALNIAGAFDQIEQIGTAAVDAVSERFDALASAAQSTVSSAEAAARQALNKFNDQSYQQQLDLLTLLGRDQDALNLQRERELESIDESLRPFQERIWQLQDEQEALSDVAQAGANYADALASANDALSDTLGSISQWVDQQAATGGSPDMDLQESQAQFARQLIAAQNGDRDALQSITQYADRYLSAGQDYYGSGTGYQSIRDDVLEALEDLPDQVSAEEYLADEFRDALEDAVDALPGGIADALAPMFDSIDANLDGLIDYDEFSSFFSGLASDDQLKQIFRQLDTNGDGQISRLEAIKGSTDQVGDNTGSLEERSLEQLQKLTGLTSEMARSTDQFIGLNSTMVSLRESIIALGVAQEEAARIEKARQEAEAAAKERVELERKLSDYESTLDNINSKLGSTQSDIADLSKQRDTYDYVDYRNEHAADEWSNINQTYKGYTGYIGDENAWWESDGLHTSGNSVEQSNVKNLWDVLKDYVHAFNKATGEGDKQLLELDETDFYGEGDSRNRFQIEYGGKTYYAGYDDQGIQTMDDAWDAMQDALNSYYGTNFDWRDGGSVRDQLDDAESSLDDLLGDRNSTQKEIDALKDQIEQLKKIEQYDGSHATGLDYVPFDGYIAETHAGERIMTAEQNRQWGPLIDGGLPPVMIPPPAVGGDNGQLAMLLRDNNRLMQQNAELLRQIEQHGAAGVRVSAEGARQQIAATERGNRSLARMESDSRLEKARA